MKRILFFLSIFLILGACSNEQTSSSENSGGGAAPQRAVPPPQPIPNTREAQLLLRDYWVFEFFIVPRNRELSDANRGKWYRFSGDGTFEAGHWQDLTTRGTWTLFYGGEYPVIHVVAENDLLTGEYQIQSVSNDTDYMSWVGTARYGQKGYAAKVLNLLSTPTRKQFGLE